MKTTLNKIILINIIIFANLIFNLSCSAENDKLDGNKMKNIFEKEKIGVKMGNDENNPNNINNTAIFAAGCFWCIEAVFQRVDGVESVTSGYIGGDVDNPTYEQICTGTTNHAEGLKIVYNPDKISYSELLEIFWTTHDPTTLNRQGNDVGTQYRSAIFYLDDEQKELAKYFKDKLNADNIYEKPIITEIVKATKFYNAENYHQNYYNQNKNQPYCSFVITPKVEKLKKIFGDKLKK